MSLEEATKIPLQTVHLQKYMNLFHGAFIADHILLLHLQSSELCPDLQRKYVEGQEIPRRIQSFR